MDLKADIGFASFSGEDDVFLAPSGTFVRLGVSPAMVRPLVKGEDVRDWAIARTEEALAPYDLVTQEPVAPTDWGSQQHLWRYRKLLSRTLGFGGKTKTEGGSNWWEWYRWISARYRGRPPIVWAYVATHNHFAQSLDGQVFRGGASTSIIKLPASATEEDHLALLAYLNSSTACFWMKQVFFPKGGHSEARPEKGIPEENRYEFAGTAMLPLPLPTLPAEGGALARRLTDLAGMRTALGAPAVVDRVFDAPDSRASLLAFERQETEVFHRMVAAQEDLDWLMYETVQLAEATGRFSVDCRLAPDQRPGFVADPPPHLSREDLVVWNARRKAILASPELQMLEDPLYKRKWWGARGVFGLKVASYAESLVEGAIDRLGDFCEDLVRNHGACCSLADMVRAGGETLSHWQEIAHMAAADVRRFAVPYLAALRFTESGLEKHRAWQHTWALQRREDAGETIADIPVPPKYAQEDYRDAVFWRLRGKLDVPKERFIAYPGCASDEDKSPVYGWAGWNHLQQAQALAALYQKRKTEEAWQKDRLTPMLAGLDELVPWVRQWHNAPSDEFGGLRLGDYFDDFVGGECEALGIRREDLAAWRPAEKTRGRAKKGARASATSGPATVSTLVIPPGYDSMGLLDGDPIALADAAKLPYEDRVRVVAVELATGATVRPWVVSGDWDGHEGTGG